MLLPVGAAGVRTLLADITLLLCHISPVWHCSCVSLWPSRGQAIPAVQRVMTHQCSQHTRPWVCVALAHLFPVTCVTRAAHMASCGAVQLWQLIGYSAAPGNTTSLTLLFLCRARDIPRTGGGCYCCCLHHWPLHCAQGGAGGSLKGWAPALVVEMQRTAASASPLHCCWREMRISQDPAGRGREWMSWRLISGGRQHEVMFCTALVLLHFTSFIVSLSFSDKPKPQQCQRASE